MTVKPKENNLIYFGTDIKVSVNLSPRQKWEVIESKVPGFIIVQKKEVKLILPKEKFPRYFTDDSV